MKTRKLASLHVTFFRTDRLCAVPGTRRNRAKRRPFAQGAGYAERRGVDFCKSFDTFILQLIFDGTPVPPRKKDALLLKNPHP
jgi:hypothetical protein